MYKNKKVSIVLPVYNEVKNIRHILEAFLAHHFVDEVVAVDNNSNDGSTEEIKKTRASYFHEPVQGYGSALRRGMREATGDLIVTVESDGTFAVKDIEKLLLYSEDFDAVYGTRTHYPFILGGSDMSLFRRVGDWAVGKLLQYLYNGPTLTDVGCTYKVIHRAAYEKIKNSLTVDGTYFSPEYMIRVIEHGLAAAETPVYYLTRVGISVNGTGTAWKILKVGVKMIIFIIVNRFRRGSFPQRTPDTFQRKLPRQPVSARKRFNSFYKDKN